MKCCKEKNEDSNLRLKILSPTLDERKDIDTYISALKYGIEKSDATNIGLIGNYSSGKSTILKSLLEENRFDSATIIISLAHFSNLTNNGEKKGNELEKLLEQKVINQILSQVNSNYLPFDIAQVFRRRNHIWENLCLTASIYIILLLSLLFNFDDVKLFADFKSDVSAWVKQSFESVFYKILIYFIFTLSFLYLLDYLVNLARTIFSKVRGISFGVGSTAIELTDDNNNSLSYFDVYSQELVSILAKSKTKLVIFEDLDRFSDYSIFEKLRELNFLINRHKKRAKFRCNRNKLVFIYAMTDEVFLINNENSRLDLGEKTKFFDLIIPVLPISSYGSNFGHFKNLFADDIDDKLLRRASEEVNDLRQIKNIYNEYQVYLNINKFLKEKKDQLFSVVLYKTVETQDFLEFYNKNGKLYALVRREFETSEPKDGLLDYLYEREYIRPGIIFYLSNFRNLFRDEDFKFIISVLDNDKYEFDDEFKKANAEVRKANGNNKYNDNISKIIAELKHFTDNKVYSYPYFYQDDIIDFLIHNDENNDNLRKMIISDDSKSKIQNIARLHEYYMKHECENEQKKIDEIICNILNDEGYIDDYSYRITPFLFGDKTRACLKKWLRISDNTIAFYSYKENKELSFMEALALEFNQKNEDYTINPDIVLKNLDELEGIKIKSVGYTNNENFFEIQKKIYTEGLFVLNIDNLKHIHKDGSGYKILDCFYDNLDEMENFHENFGDEEVRKGIKKHIENNLHDFLELYKKIPQKSDSDNIVVTNKDDTKEKFYNLIGERYDKETKEDLLKILDRAK